ncbi:hypothetical protein PF003_g24672 [Phytophthora fragariae]|nr:hypothetical protein PF003_g24672 [Phytophthora fragariae]
MTHCLLWSSSMSFCCVRVVSLATQSSAGVSLRRRHSRSFSLRVTWDTCLFVEVDSVSTAIIRTSCSFSLQTRK